nr:bag-associated gram protein 1 [Quercus suber]
MHICQGPRPSRPPHFPSPLSLFTHLFLGFPKPLSPKAVHISFSFSRRSEHTTALPSSLKPKPSRLFASQKQRTLHHSLTDCLSLQIGEFEESSGLFRELRVLRCEPSMIKNALKLQHDFDHHLSISMLQLLMHMWEDVNGYAGANARRRISLDKHVHQKPGPLQTIFDCFTRGCSTQLFLCT